MTRFFDIRRLLRIVQNTDPYQPPEIIISVDAEKVFGRVEWSYFFQCLERFKFGLKFIT